MNEPGAKKNLAIDTGFPFSTIRGWADPNGSLPTVEEGLDIANSLGISLEALVTGGLSYESIADTGNVVAEGPPPTYGTRDERRLVDAFRSLPAERRQEALDYMEYLATKHGEIDKREETG